MTTRQRVWLEAWTAVAGCWNQKDIDACARWADRCLKAFDERFPDADLATDKEAGSVNA